MSERIRNPSVVEAALREERGLVLAFGGYAVEIAGGVLVTNERVPVPRFNFVQSVRLHRRRQAAFFERALDHYFQRALRPSFRVESPAPEFVDASLRRLGFRPAPQAETLLLWSGASAAAAAGGPFSVAPATPEEIPLVASFWTGTHEQEEFLRALQVVLHQPNPDERLLPVIARRDGNPVAVGLLHSYQHAFGIHGVSTQPPARGQGAATALVAHVLHRELPASAHPVALWAESERLERHLHQLGFRTVEKYTVYELPADAQLAILPRAPPGPPRWRPLRRSDRTPAG